MQSFLYVYVKSNSVIIGKIACWFLRDIICLYDLQSYVIPMIILFYVNYFVNVRLLIYFRMFSIVFLVQTHIFIYACLCDCVYLLKNAKIRKLLIKIFDLIFFWFISVDMYIYFITYTSVLWSALILMVSRYRFCIIFFSRTRKLSKRFIDVHVPFRFLFHWCWIVLPILL